MANRVNVNPDLIDWAIDRSGLPLASYPDVVAAWLDKSKQPTFQQLEKFAKKARVPFGYLFLDAPPEELLPLPDYRTMSDSGIDRPSPDLIDTIHDMQRRQAWMREYLLEEGHSRVAFVGSESLDSPVPVVVTGIRRFLELKPEWARDHESWENALRFLLRRIEANGVLVFINGVVGNSTRRALDAEEFRGFVLCDSIAPLIFVNGSDTKGAQMFTLAHELAHVAIGKDALFNLPELRPSSNEVEKFCNRVAAEFLVPEKKLREAWDEMAGQERPFVRLAGRFKVSPIVVARRAKDLRLITDEQFFGFYHAYMREIKRKKENQKGGGDFYRNQSARLGRRFGQAVIVAAETGRLTYQEAYDLTGLRGATFDRFAAFLKKQER